MSTPSKKNRECSSFLSVTGGSGRLREEEKRREREKREKKRGPLILFGEGKGAPTFWRGLINETGVCVLLPPFLVLWSVRNWNWVGNQSCLLKFPPNGERGGFSFLFKGEIRVLMRCSRKVGRELNLATRERREGVFCIFHAV